VTAMFSTEQEAKALAAELIRFARSQSVLVAPFSSEDEQRIAALGAGERALAAGASHDVAAAQLHRDLQTAVAHGALGIQPGIAAAVAGAAPQRFCSACGTAALPGAKYCSNCAAALTS